MPIDIIKYPSNLHLMLTTLTVLIILVLLTILWFFFQKRKSFPILLASIYQDTKGKAKVIFEEKHPSVNEAEYLKICLHFISKSLNICKDLSEKKEIFRFLNFIADQNFESLDQRQIDNDDFDLNSSSKITATLRYVDSLSRIIICKVPIKYFSGNGLILNSVKAVFWKVHDKVNEENKEILIKSITRMNEMFDSEYSTKSFKDMTYVPNQAFLESW